MLNPGDRVWVNVPGLALLVSDASWNGRAGRAVHGDRARRRSSADHGDAGAHGGTTTKSTEDPEKAEYLVRVKWDKTVPEAQAIKERGFFGKQNTVAKPRADSWRHTVELDQQDSMYELSKPSKLESVWGTYWRRLFRGAEGDRERDMPADAYEPMPLLRYEVTLRSWEKAFEEYRQIASNESGWFLIERDPTSPVVADVYGNVFGTPLRAGVRVSRVDKETAKALSAMFDMDAWPDASEQQIGRALESVAQHAVALVAFDIGQGSASALLDEGQVPFVYHDLGAGITNNARTTPVPLKFCWTRNPVVVLSHWDKDHWAGALKDRGALSRTWIVPRQIISVGHAAFGSDILRAGGRILVWSGQQPCIQVPLYRGQSMTVGRCTGKDRNGSCLAIHVDDENHGELRHWLLTGDAGYDQLPFALPGQVVAITVPHHGAAMAVNKSVPAGTGRAYGRLLYSFGPGNRFGSTQHPTSASVSEHENAGWNAGGWHSASQPGTTLAGRDILATAQHASLHLGGAVAGWDTPPTPLARPCRRRTSARLCSTEIKQS